MAQALIYELALITGIFGLDWIGSAKMDPCPTLVQHNPLFDHTDYTYNMAPCYNCNIVQCLALFSLRRGSVVSTSVFDRRSSLTFDRSMVDR